MTEKFYLEKEQKDLKETKLEAKRQRDKELDDVRWVLSNPRGRRFLWRLLELAGIYRTPYIPKDTNETMKQIGYKEVGLFVVDEITHADTDALLKMQQEYISSEKSKRQEKEGEKQNV